MPKSVIASRMLTRVPTKTGIAAAISGTIRPITIPMITPWLEMVNSLINELGISASADAML